MTLSLNNKFLHIIPPIIRPSMSPATSFSSLVIVPVSQENQFFPTGRRGVL